MSSVEISAEEFKSCCSAFYADELVRRILGDSFHPGGEQLTRDLLRAGAVGPADHLLDVATGPGTSAILAARELGCRVTAVDLSEENLRLAAAGAEAAGVADRVTTRPSDAERLPFADQTFDVVLCECAFCTFVDKPTAAREMARVLVPGGRLLLSDMVIRGRLPDDLRMLMARVACLADALAEDALTAMFAGAGFVDAQLTDQRWALTDMVSGIQKRLLAVDLASRLGKLELGGIDLEEGKRFARRSLEVIEEGRIGYVALEARLPRG